MTKQEKSIIRRLKKIGKELGEMERSDNSEIDIIIGFAEKGNGDLRLYCNRKFINTVSIKLLTTTLEAGDM